MEEDRLKIERAVIRSRAALAIVVDTLRCKITTTALYTVASRPAHASVHALIRRD